MQYKNNAILHGIPATGGGGSIIFSDLFRGAPIRGWEEMEVLLM